MIPKSVFLAVGQGTCFVHSVFRLKPRVFQLLFALIFSSPLHADVTVSTLTELPTENVAIAVGSQESVMAVNTRNTLNAEEGNYTGVAQSFQWNNDGKLTGIGLYLHPDQEKFPWRSHESQRYVLHIHSGDGPSMDEGTHVPVETFSFTIRGSEISNTGGKWLYLELPGLELKKGQWYGFQIGPDSQATNASLRLFFQISNTDYEGYSQALNLADTEIPAEISYTNNMGGAKDLTFFMTTTTRPAK